MKVIDLESAFQSIAEKIASELGEGSLIGLGSGSAVGRFVKVLGKKAREDHIQVQVIPSSLQIQLLAEEVGLKLAPAASIPSLQLTVDGADQIDRNLILVKGGGGALFRERVLLSASRRSHILADESKFVAKINRPIPVEVSPYARRFVEEKIKGLEGKPILRSLEKGYPYITENSNVILDSDFGIIEDPLMLMSQLKDLPGVIEVGIFKLRSSTIYRARRNGSYDTLVIK